MAKLTFPRREKGTTTESIEKALKAGEPIAAQLVKAPPGTVVDRSADGMPFAELVGLHPDTPQDVAVRLFLDGEIPAGVADAAKAAKRVKLERLLNRRLDMTTRSLQHDVDIDVVRRLYEEECYNAEAAGRKSYGVLARVLERMRDELGVTTSQRTLSDHLAAQGLRKKQSPKR